MAQQSKLGTVATKVKKEGGVTGIKYHATNVVEFTGTMIVLDSGGWRSATTKTRMNQASNQFNLGYSVWQKSREWFVTFKGVTCEFYDGMVLVR